MMLLGLVIHSSISYGKIDFNPIWPIKDPFNTNLFFDMLVDFIHVFRMPVFFVIAGFFGSLIFYYRGPKKMILNRVKRIILPFIIALLFLWPLTLFLGTYTKSQITGNPNSFVYAANSLINGSIIPINTIHLWFLYYLIYFSVSGWVLALLLKRLQGLCYIIKNCFEVIHRHALIKYLSLSIITFACFFVMNLPVAVTSTSLIPHLPSFTLYMIFYLYGWLLFKSKHLLNSFMNKAWLLFAFAVLLFTLKIIV